MQNEFNWNKSTFNDWLDNLPILDVLNRINRIEILSNNSQ